MFALIEMFSADALKSPVTGPDPRLSALLTTIESVPVSPSMVTWACKPPALVPRTLLVPRSFNSI